MEDTARRPLPPCRPGFSDHIYRTIHGVSLPLRIWPAKGIANGAWVLWLHGGSFAGGKWSSPTTWVPAAFCDAGYVVVSVGYRLLPDVTLSEILDDCLAAHGWCLSNSESLGIDPRLCVVAGASAGGTAATLLPFKLNTHPVAIVNVYGMVDVFDRTHHDPLPFPTDPPVTHTPESVLEADLHHRQASRALTQAPWITDIPPTVPLQECRAHLGLEYTPTKETYYRIDLVNYMTKRRIMLRLLLDASNDTTEEFHAKLTKINPLGLLDTVSTYPPTFMLNGTADEYVPVHEPIKMAGKLRAMGVPVGEVYPEGKGHVFDWEIQTPNDWGWEECVVPLVAFVDAHVQKAKAARWCSVM